MAEWSDADEAYVCDMGIALYKAMDTGGGIYHRHDDDDPPPEFLAALVRLARFMRTGVRDDV